MKKHTTHSKYKGVIVGTTTIERIKDNLQVKRDELMERIAQSLAYVGEECVRIAREDHPGNWRDITGNLRSSIGYIVLIDGEPISSLKDQFVQTAGVTGDGSQGLLAAKSLLQTLQGEYSKGVVLIVTAGMHYAAFVENIRHKVVLSQARLMAEKLVKQLIGSFIQ